MLGFIGLGTMGEPMCANLARKGGQPVIAFDLSSEPLARLAAHGVTRADSFAALSRAADIVFLSLPGGKELAQVCEGASGLLALSRKGQTIVDLGTSPVPLSRDLATRFAAKASTMLMRRWRARGRRRSTARSASWSAAARLCSRASSRCCAPWPAR